MRRPTRAYSTQTQPLHRSDTTHRHRHSSHKKKRHYHPTKSTSTQKRKSKSSRRGKKNKVQPVSYVMTSMTGSRIALNSSFLQQPASAIQEHLWPKTYLTVAILSIIFMPLTGVFATYAAVQTKNAIKKGHFALATERSYNTKAILIYTYAMGVIALATVTAITAIMWVLANT